MVLINLGALKKSSKVCELDQKHSILLSLTSNLGKIPNSPELTTDLITIFSNYTKAYFDEKIAVEVDLPKFLALISIRAIDKNSKSSKNLQEVLLLWSSTQCQNIDF